VKNLEGITVLDADGLILYEGPSVEHLLGYKPDEMVGRHAGGLGEINPEDVAPLIDKIRRALEQQKDIQTLRWRGRRRDGSNINIEAVGND
jgi:PAS domain S-box-containing protein